MGLKIIDLDLVCIWCKVAKVETKGDMEEGIVSVCIVSKDGSRIGGGDGLIGCEMDRKVVIGKLGIIGWRSGRLELGEVSSCCTRTSLAEFGKRVTGVNLCELVPAEKER